MPEFKTYVGAKIILAQEMDEDTFLSVYKKEDVSGRQETRPGYTVIYPDGYKSWSPKDVFENAYREVLPSEKALLTPPPETVCNEALTGAGRKAE